MTKVYFTQFDGKLGETVNKARDAWEELSHKNIENQLEAAIYMLGEDRAEESVIKGTLTCDVDHQILEDAKSNPEDEVIPQLEEFIAILNK